VKELFGGSHDEQWHTAPGFTVKNWAYDGLCCDSDPYYRPITSRKYRDSQALNTLVCQYGKTNGYSCGYLVSKVLQCGTPSPQPTCMRLHRDNIDLSDQGDSRGPVYVSTSAWGIPPRMRSSAGTNYLQRRRLRERFGLHSYQLLRVRPRNHCPDIVVRCE